ncbi:MAG: MEDS domain-containing protein [Rhodanobacteraceae bacterium]
MSPVKKAALQFALSGGWKGMGETAHFVQFYNDDKVLLDSICGFIGGGLIAGAGCVVIATPKRIRDLETQLIDRGFDLDSARRWKQFSALVAADTLATFMVDGMPDPERFAAVVGSVIAGADTDHPRVLAFGEMVGLLWSEGNRAAAVELEKLWNALAKRYGCSVFCAYPANDIDREAHAREFAHVCAEHSGVIHADHYASGPIADR